MVFTLKWGILSTGNISSTMAKDLLIDPSTRNVSDIAHKLVAVASRSVPKAQSFIDQFCKGDKSIKAYGSYEEFYQDKDVECVYIGTPHSHHYSNTMDCLNAGKHVLLEKPATVTAEQTIKLIETAKEKNLFLMEACWTRFFPLAYEIQEHLNSGAIGTIRHVHAEFCMAPGIETTMDASHRLIDPNLAGGSILDQGPYPYIWTCLGLIHPLLVKNPAAASAAGSRLPLPKITSSIVKSSPALTKKVGGVIDVHDIVILKFPSTYPAENDETGGEVSAIMETSLIHNSPKDRAVLIAGTKGQITVRFPPYRAQEYLLEVWDDETSYGKRDESKVKKQERKFEFPGGAHGFIYEADETARCIKDGKIECERMPWRETILMMEIFDEVRKQNDYKYPAALEGLEGTPSS